LFSNSDLAALAVAIAALGRPMTDGTRITGRRSGRRPALPV